MAVYPTIEDFVSSKKEIYMSYDFLSLYEKIENNIYVSYNLLNDYLSDIKLLTKEIILSDAELNKYKYKPKLFCSEIYGSKELYFIILMLNDMVSPKDFTKNKLKLLYQTDMEQLVTHLIKAEKNSKK